MKKGKKKNNLIITIKDNKRFVRFEFPKKNVKRFTKADVWLIFQEAMCQLKKKD